MKICLITNFYKPYKDWPKVYPEIIAEELARENEVIVITLRPFSGLGSLKASIEDSGSIKVYRFYPLNVYSLHYPPKHHPSWIKAIWHLIDIWNLHSYFVIKQILKKEKPDIVHTLRVDGLSASVFAAVKASGCPHAHTLLDGALISPWAALLRNGKTINFNFFDRQYMKARRFLSESVDMVLASYNFLLDIHLQNGYFKGRPVRVFPYPVRLRPSVLKSKSYTPINLLCVGAIVAGKGIYVLLDAFKKLNRSDVNLHFIGMGAELEELKKAAHGLKNVSIQGYISDEDLVEMYSRANITIVPTLFPEDNPFVTIESFSFGTPVIASNLNGIPETITDGLNGRLFEPGDSLALKDALDDLISDHDKLREMEAEALKSAEKYSLGKHISNLLEIYRSLVHASTL
ncbi:glycosyltransferase [Chloroflexota bacterium]